MSDGLPLAVFAYKRPALLRRVFNALKVQGISRLIVFVDGPRGETDRSAVEACRALARSVSWAETELIIKPENRGPMGLVDNIDWVFERYPAAVFVEDDCLPSPGFYSFIQAGLAKYNGEKSVFSIGGYQPIAASRLAASERAAFVSARFIGWGWGSWRDRWQEIRSLLDGYTGLFDGLRFVPQVAGDDLPWMALKMAGVETGADWDIRVALASLYLKKVHIHAARGLVRNIGLGMGGVHTGPFTGIRNSLLHNKNIVARAQQDLRWPPPELDCEYTFALRDFVRQTQSLSPRRWLRRGWSALRRWFRPGYPRVTNLDLQGKPDRILNRRALLAYIVHPFFIAPDDPRFYGHVNLWHAHEMVRTLNQMGYCVDIVDYRDTKFFPQVSYDLFVGHGGINFTRIATRLPVSTQRIYFSTGSYWQFHNQQEQRRSQALQKRRGVTLLPDRPIQHGEEAALGQADGILGIGNDTTRQTYAKYEHVVMIDSTARFDALPDWCKHDHETSRTGFMFFAPSGNLHKGLDLVLETFAGLENLHLWVLSPLEPGFRTIYRQELFRHHNIHAVGRVQPRSERFYRAMYACDWCILPSCSEGQSTSVLDCMNQGLIPIVTREAGIDVEDFGEWIEPVEIDVLQTKVQRLAGLPLEEIRRRSQLARLAACTRYSEASFRANFRAGLERLLAENEHEPTLH